MKFNLIFISICILVFTGCGIDSQNISTPKGKNEISKNKELAFVEKTREPVSENLKTFIKDVINSFSQNDLEKINQKYINQDFGYYDLYKVEGNISFENKKEIYNFVEEDLEYISNIIYRVKKNAINYVIIEQDLSFNCSPNDDAYYGWNGEGLYLSAKTNPILQELMQKANEYKANTYSKEEIQKAKFIEETAYKITLTPELVFYVNKIQDKWYITLFDRITTNCSSS